MSEKRQIIIFQLFIITNLIRRHYGVVCCQGKMNARIRNQIRLKLYHKGKMLLLQVALFICMCVGGRKWDRDLCTEYTR